MNIFYLLNYAIFAVFLTMFMLEVGVALLLLLDYKESSDKVRRYIMPIWEIEGTFGVFYLVNLVATYPLLIPIISSAYLLPIMMAAALLIFRNAFLVFSEYISKPDMQRKYTDVYAISTLLIAFLLVSVLSSVVSGAGYNVLTSAGGLGEFFFNGYNLLMFFSILMINLFLTAIFFQCECLKRINILALIISLPLLYMITNTYANYMIANLVQNELIAIILALLVLIDIYLYIRENKLARYLTVVWLFLAILFFGVLQYPYLLGGSLSYLNLMTNAQIEGSILLITTIGGILLVLALILFIYISYVKKGDY